MLKQGLEIKQTQKLSPLQIQTIKLIELPQQELEQRIRKELEENPVLDEEQPSESDEEQAPREVSLSDYKEDDYIPSYRMRSDLYNSKEERPQYNTFSVKESSALIAVLEWLVTVMVAVSFDQYPSVLFIYS